MPTLATDQVTSLSPVTCNSSSHLRIGGQSVPRKFVCTAPISCLRYSCWRGFSVNSRLPLGTFFAESLTPQKMLHSGKGGRTPKRRVGGAPLSCDINDECTCLLWRRSVHYARSVRLSCYKDNSMLYTTPVASPMAQRYAFTLHGYG